MTGYLSWIGKVCPECHHGIQFNGMMWIHKEVILHPITHMGCSCMCDNVIVKMAEQSLREKRGEIDWDKSVDGRTG